MPARIRSATEAAVMSRPSNRMRPSSGISWALIRLTSVVLPAPFDPTRDKNSPLSTLKSTASTARKAPKRLLNPTVSTTATLGGLCLPPAMNEAARRPDDAGRQHQDEDDEHRAQQELPVFGHRHRVGLEIIEDDAADDRPAEIAEPAHQGHEHDLAGK